jgi:hypothetical protein
VARGQPGGDWPAAKADKNKMYDQTHHVIEDKGDEFSEPNLPGWRTLFGKREKAPKNREMKEEPTILLIIKDRLREPTMFMKTTAYAGRPRY